MILVDLLSSQPWVERVGRTLLHFLWQGALIAALYAVVRGLTARARPNARYILSSAALALMMATPLVTFYLMRTSDRTPAFAGTTVRTAPSAYAGGSSLPSFVSATMSGVQGGQFLTWVVMLWLFGAIALWLRLAGGWVVAARMRSTLVRPAPPEWQQTLNKLSAIIQVARPVRLLVSARVRVPAVVGWLRPVVLVPIGALTGLPIEHVEAFLMHELAHIRRHDYMVNILQSVGEALLFYHPAVWWVSGHMRTERELCCDDIAVSISGDALTYARALAELESYRPVHLALAVSGGSLGERIARLLGQSRQDSRTLSGPGVIVSAILLVVTAWGMFGQAAALPRFKTASIKPNNTKSPVSAGVGYGEATEMDVTLKMLMTVAYSLQEFQISGGPSWVGSDRFDVEAKAEDPRTEPDQVRIMLRSLLADRFKLKLRRDTRDSLAYSLVVGEGGPKIKLAPDQTSPTVNGPAPPGAGPNRGAIRIGAGSLTGNAVSLSLFARFLSQRLDRPIIDKTNLAGRYNIQLRWTPVVGENPSDPGGETLPPADPSRPTVFAAIQEQLGLKLESISGPVENFIIDQAERPTGN